MSKEACIIRLEEEYKDKGVSTAYLNELLDNIEDIRANAETHADFVQKSREFFQQRQYDLADSQRNRVENAIKLNQEISNFRAQKVLQNNPKEYLNSILDGTSMKGVGVNKSIATETKVVSLQHKQMLAQALQDEGLLDVAKKGDVDEEIFRYIMDGDKGVSDAAKRIGDVYTKIDKSLFNIMEIAGSTKRNLRERVVRRTYNAEKLVKSGFNDFKTFMLERLDIDRMTREGTLTPGEDPSLFLKELYGDVIAGNYEKSLSTSVSVDQAPLRGNADVRKRRHRFVHFRNGKGEFEFIKEFGNGTVFGGVMSNIEGTARDAAVFKRLGTKAAENWNSIKAEVGRSFAEPEIDPKTGKEIPPSDKKLKAFSEFQGKIAQLDNLFDYVSHGPKGGSSRTARISGNLRALSSMSKLGSAVVKAGITDVASTIANFKTATGESWLGSHGKALSTIIKSVPKSNRAQFAKMTQTYFNNALGDHHSKFASGDIVGGHMAKAQDIFFKLNGMTDQTDIWKTANQALFSARLAENAGKSLDSLDASFKAQLERYGFDDMDMSNISNALENIEGTTYVSQEMLDTADLKVPEGWKEADYRHELKMKVGSYLIDNSEIGSPTPGAREQSFFLNGTNLDTPMGQFLMFVSQFKTFPLTMHRIMSRIALGDPDTAASSLLEVLKHPIDNAGATKRLAGSMLTLTAFGYMANTAAQFVKGRTPQDPTDPTTIVEAMITGGSGGLFGDYLFGEYNKRYKNLSSDILGPVLGGTFSSAAEVWAGMIRGEAKASSAFNILIQNAPFGNLIFARTAMDYLLLDDVRESLSPGYRRRRKASLKESGQELWLGE